MGKTNENKLFEPACFVGEERPIPVCEYLVARLEYVAELRRIIKECMQ